MSKTISTCYFFIEEGMESIIKVKGSSYKINDDDDEFEEKNAEIRIDPMDGSFELSISIPKEDLKKLVVAAKKFLETGKSALFYDDRFRIGNDQEGIPAKEVLKSV